MLWADAGAAFQIGAVMITPGVTRAPNWIV